MYTNEEDVWAYEVRVTGMCVCTCRLMYIYMCHTYLCYVRNTFAFLWVAAFIDLDLTPCCVVLFHLLPCCRVSNFFHLSFMRSFYMIVFSFHDSQLIREAHFLCWCLHCTCWPSRRFWHLKLGDRVASLAHYFMVSQGNASTCIQFGDLLIRNSGMGDHLL